MTNLLNCLVIGLPKPQGSLTRMISASSGKAVSFYPKSKAGNRTVADYRADVITEIHKHREPGTEPCGHPINIECVFRLPRPKSHFGTGKNSQKLKDSAPKFPAKIPDVDKLLRALNDAVTASAVIWGDDSQVVAISAFKVFAPSVGVPPATWIGIECLGDCGGDGS